MNQAVTAHCRLTEVYDALNAACLQPGGQAALARKAGVSAAYLNMAVNGERNITGPVLRALGFRKIISVSYERISA